MGRMGRMGRMSYYQEVCVMVVCAVTGFYIGLVLQGLYPP